MALNKCILFGFICTPILGTSMPLSGNATSDCPSWNTLSWVLLAVCIIILIAFVAVLIYCCKGKYKKLRSGHAEECRQIIAEKPVVENENWKIEKEILAARFYRDDVFLDPETAHPRLEVSKGGKSVRDTGNVSKVSMCDKRFDSHTFVLATKCFSSGKHYWEVEVGEKRKWDLGVASESAPRKGEIIPSPKNDYWVIGLDGGKDYWARTEQWTRLQVTAKLVKIGILLNVTTGILSFYDVNNNSKVFSYSIRSSGKFYPFFSTGSVTAELDDAPLKIPPWFEEERLCG